jgi:alkyl hydroperoxide reductase subunit F
LVELDDRKQIKINNRNETKTAGLFAAGDVTEVPYKQIVIAAGEGAKAALAAYDYITANTQLASQGKEAK